MSFLKTINLITKELRSSPKRRAHIELETLCSPALQFRPYLVIIRDLLQVEKAVIPLVHICPLRSLVSGVSVHIIGDAFTFN
jgi:hypothetical protein